MLRDFARRATDQFRHYQHLHEQKTPPDLVKAAANMALADEGERSLAAPETSDQAFRRGAHAAVQAIIDDFADLIERRNKAQSPRLVTEAIVAMGRRIIERPYPTEDPGPVSQDTPDVPAPPRPTVETLIAVAALAAEETGLPITLVASSDGIVVRGSTAIRSALRAFSWTEISLAEVPVLSLAVAEVAEELRR